MSEITNAVLRELLESWRTLAAEKIRVKTSDHADVEAARLQFNADELEAAWPRTEAHVALAEILKFHKRDGYMRGYYAYEEIQKRIAALEAIVAGRGLTP